MRNQRALAYSIRFQNITKRGSSALPLAAQESKANWMRTLRFAFISPCVDSERMSEGRQHLPPAGPVFWPITETDRKERLGNESQRLTGRILRLSVCVRSSGQWSLFGGQHPSPVDGPVSSAARDSKAGILTNPGAGPRHANEQVFRPEGETRSLPGKTDRDLNQVETGPRFGAPFGSSPVSSACDLAERAKIRDHALKKSNELRIREWEQVPLNKRDHDLRALEM